MKLCAKGPQAMLQHSRLVLTIMPDKIMHFEPHDFHLKWLL